MEPWNELEAARAALMDLQPDIRGEVSPGAHILGVLALGEGEGAVLAAGVPEMVLRTVQVWVAPPAMAASISSIFLRAAFTAA